MSAGPFGDWMIQGPRPVAEPVERGEWEPGTVYLAGDRVTWNNETWEAIGDYRSGLFSPDIVENDYPGTIWTREDK